MKLSIKRIVPVTTSNHVRAVHDFLKRNEILVPEGMDETIENTGLRARHFYLVAEEKSGNIIGLAEISPFGYKCEPDYVLKLRVVGLDKRDQGLGMKKEFIRHIFEACRIREIPVIAMENKSMEEQNDYDELGFVPHVIGNLYYMTASLYRRYAVNTPLDKQYARETYAAE